MTAPVFRVRTAKGTVHALTNGRRYTDQGRALVNSADSSTGKAACGAITSGAATLTDTPLTCAGCLARHPQQ